MKRIPRKTLFVILSPLVLVCIIPLALALNETQAESFWQKLLRITGISATPREQKAPGDDIKGDIWLVNLAQKAQLRVTKDGGYRSPVFLSGDENILALREKKLLLSIGLEFQDDLDNGTISERLQEEFRSNRASLSDEATVSIEEAGSRWRITDKAQVYIIRKERNTLNICGNNIVQIPVSGDAKILYAIKEVVKIVGFDRKDLDKVLILLEDEDGRSSVGLLSLRSGEVTFIPYNRKSKEDRCMVNHIKGWERVYGDTKVYVKGQTKIGVAGRRKWTDVYIKKGDKNPENLSNGDGVNCGHPSLSHDGRQVVFVKEVE